MDHGADIALIDADAKGGGGDDNVDPVLRPVVDYAYPLLVRCLAVELFDTFEAVGDETIVPGPRFIAFGDIED